MDREDIKDFVEGLIGFGSLFVIIFMMMVIGG
jgi:hypothetical protein